MTGPSRARLASGFCPRYSACGSAARWVSDSCTTVSAEALFLGKFFMSCLCCFIRMVSGQIAGLEHVAGLKAQRGGAAGVDFQHIAGRRSAGIAGAAPAARAARRRGSGGSERGGAAAHVDDVTPTAGVLPPECAWHLALETEQHGPVFAQGIAEQQS